MAGKVYVLDQKLENVLSRLHRMGQEDIVLLCNEDQKYGPVEIVEAVRKFSQEYVERFVRGKEKLSGTMLDELNTRVQNVVPHLHAAGEDYCWAYAVSPEMGGKEQLWFPMFATWYSTGRLKECSYEKCGRVFVPKFKSTAKHCSPTCGNAAYRMKYGDKHNPARRREYMKEYMRKYRAQGDQAMGARQKTE